MTVSDTVDVSFTSRPVIWPGTGGGVWGVGRYKMQGKMHRMQGIRNCAYRTHSVDTQLSSIIANDATVYEIH